MIVSIEGDKDLDLPVQNMRGIGIKRSKVLETIGIHTIRDLLHYYPFGYLDRSTIVSIVNLKQLVQSQKPVTIVAEVVQSEVHRSRKTNRQFFLLTVKDETGFLTCFWFEGIEYRRNAFKNGEILALSAIPTLDRLQRPSFAHPEFDRLASVEEDEPDWGKLFNTGAIIPKYSSSKELDEVGLDSRGFRRILRNAIKEYLPFFVETLPEYILSKRNFPSLSDAIQTIHFPASDIALESARKRLKYEELFFLQLLLIYRKSNRKRNQIGISYNVKSNLARKLLDSLPFELTKAQRRSLKEITDDMQSTAPMNRLLQGDVGCGKTIVALLAMAIAVENEFQCALMAPTEILAEQHYKTISRFVQPIGISVQLLIGNQKKKDRIEILKSIEEGKINIVIGTHAVIEEEVSFLNLGFIVIDEQHRFGVMQRSKLQAKGKNPDVLVMSATPIPRSLVMTFYGDLDVSIIDELPPHRRNIRTYAYNKSKIKNVYEFVRNEIKKGYQAFIVFPLIEESSESDLKAAMTEKERLEKEVFTTYSVGLLHSKIKEIEKDEIMNRFQKKEIQILVSTTVIEVGIDIPNASVMVIEDAERFGLAQLHQLRGRVGRGATQSYCLLVTDMSWYDKKFKKSDRILAQEEKNRAAQRIETMLKTTDGFEIAQVDLLLRGPGEILGTKQSGMPMFRIADIRTDEDILKFARADAEEIVLNDSLLVSSVNSELRSRIESEIKKIDAILSTG